MKISVRFEGGMGDFMLGNRWIPAIKELYPNAQFTAFCDTDGAKFQAEMLKSCYGHFYKDVIIIPGKKEKEYIIESPFGRENYPSYIRNLPDKYTNSMLEDFDKFYDLHVDSLAYLSYDFDWFKYHRVFPTPIFKDSIEKPFGRYIVCNLFSTLANPHQLDLNYCKSLLHSVSRGMPIVCITTDETAALHKELIEESDRCIHFKGNISQVGSLIKNCTGFIGIDSGFKYFAYAFSKPTLTFTKHSPEPHKVLFSHKLRWLPFETDCVPPNYDLEYCLKFFAKMLNSKLFWMKPDLQNLVGEAVDRFGYTIERR